MRGQWGNFFVGLFALVTAIFTTLAVIFFSGREDESRLIHVETLFAEAVTGLEVGAPVRFRGVEIGRVSEVTLPGTAYGLRSDTVLVRFILRVKSPTLSLADVRESLLDWAERGLRLRLKPMGFTGIVYIDAEVLEDVDRYPQIERPWKTDEYIYLPSAPSPLKEFLDMTHLTLESLSDADVAEMVESARGTVGIVATAIQEIREGGLAEAGVETLSELDDLLDVIDQVLEKKTDGFVASLVRFDRLVGGVEDVLQDPAILGTLQGLEAGSADLESHLSRSEIPTTLQNVETATGQAERSLVQLQAGLDELRIFLKGANGLVGGKEKDLVAILRNLAVITSHLRNLTRRLEGDPSSVWRGGRPRESAGSGK